MDKSAVIGEHGLHDKDSGSADVQIALLTKRINHLTEHLKVHAKDHQGEVRDPSIDHDLHPMESEVADPVQLLDRVMELVELPQPGHAVKQHVNGPFEKVLEKKERDELQPERSRAQHVQRFGLLDRRNRPSEQVPRDER